MLSTSCRTHRTNAHRYGVWTAKRATTTSSSDDSPQKHTITWKTKQSTIQFDAYDGELLRTAALRRGLVSPHNGRANLINCRGLGTCGTCAVHIESDYPLPRRNTIEEARLSLPPHKADALPVRRLACQVLVYGDVTVTKYTGFWGQCDEVVDDISAPTCPFGDLEYVLDRTSPGKDEEFER